MAAVLTKGKGITMTRETAWLNLNRIVRALRRIQNRLGTLTQSNRIYSEAGRREYDRLQASYAALKTAKVLGDS